MRTPDELRSRAEQCQTLTGQLRCREREHDLHKKLDVLLGQNGLQRELVRDAEQQIVGLANDRGRPGLQMQEAAIPDVCRLRTGRSSLPEGAERVLRFLLLLLSDTAARDFSQWAGTVPPTDGKRGAIHSLFESTLFESLLRALDRDPERIDQVAQLTYVAGLLVAIPGCKLLDSMLFLSVQTTPSQISLRYLRLDGPRTRNLLLLRYLPETATLSQALSAEALWRTPGSDLPSPTRR